MSVIKSVIKSNENRSKILLNRIYEILSRKIKNKRITFLGVTFKANTDDMRDSSCLKMIPWLSKKGAIIKYFDPTGFKIEFSKLKNVTNLPTIKEAVQGADLVIIHTEWNDFKSINFKNLVKVKFIIYDMRNIYLKLKLLIKVLNNIVLENKINSTQKLHQPQLYSQRKTICVTAALVCILSLKVML